MSGTPFVRPYRSTDRAWLYDVCVRTADGGGDARHIYSDADLDLVPSIFAGPYVHLEPDLAFVLDNGERAVGYIVGTSDTAAFVRDYRTRWLPALEDRYPAPRGPARTRTDAMIAVMHDPERMLRPELAAYPAHLHIDLLPAYQRRGHGRALMYAFLDALRHKSVPAVHLGMASSNSAARAFYDRLDFHEIRVPGAGSTTYLGRATSGL